jgi:hypothetical protein
MPKDKKEKKSKTLETGIEDVEMADVTSSKVCLDGTHYIGKSLIKSPRNRKRSGRRKRKRIYLLKI